MPRRTNVDDLQVHPRENGEKKKSGFLGSLPSIIFGGVMAAMCFFAAIVAWSVWPLPLVFIIFGLGLFWWVGLKRAWTIYKPLDMFYYSYISPIIEMEEPLNIWEGIPVGVDANKNPVSFSPTDTSMLIGGETRSGKSGAIRNMVASFVMDPYVEVSIFNGKGGPDYMPFVRVAKVVNKNPVALMNYLAQMELEVERRWDRLQELDEDKLTPEISRQEMPVKVIIIDEYRRYIRDKECGPTITESLIEIGATGAGCGILLIIANQRVSKDIVVPDLIDNLSLRWAFRVRDVTASNLILGPGAAGRGFDASKIKRESWRGVGWMDADGGVPRLVRAYLFERQQLNKVVEKAYKFRQDAETLPEIDAQMAYDPGDEKPSYEMPAPAPRSTLLDLLEVFWEGERSQWIRTLVNRAAERWPDVYTEINDDNSKLETGKYSKLLREAGVKVNNQVNIGGIRKSGIKKADLEQAVSDQIRDAEQYLKDNGIDDDKNTFDYSELAEEIPAYVENTALNPNLGPENPDINPNNIDYSTAEGKKLLLLLSNVENKSPKITDNKITAAELRRNREKAAFDALNPQKKAAHKSKVAEIKASEFCDYCGWTYTRKDKYSSPTVDHYDPVSSDAPHTQEPWNLRSCCWACNISKRNSPGGEWYARVMSTGGFDQLHGGPKINCRICNPHREK